MMKGTKMRYEILVKNGRKIILLQQYSSYNEAMLDLEAAEEIYGHMYAVEFKDNRPFNR